MSTVCVLLPFRDAEGTLDDAIASIAGQGFQDQTLLLIDNASTDGSAAIAAQWCARDPRIRTIAEPRIGIAHALNTGLFHVRTRFIARMDADDVAHPERLAKQVAFLQAHPDIGVVGTRTTFATTVRKSSGMQWFVGWQNAILTPQEHYVKRFVDAPLAHPTVMFRRSLIDAHGGYDEGPLPEDHELWLRWMHAGVRFAKLPEEMLTWNDHERRLSRTHPNYSVDAFFDVKAKWLAAWYRRRFPEGRPIIVAGTSGLCRQRAARLEAEGLRIHAFTDVSGRGVPGRAFIPHDRLPGAGEAFVVSFISQRGTGDRIAAFLAARGLVEGTDFLLAA
ncbi:MAG: glycosyltransferase [Bacteroidetes bacterium]|nr:glycosyltransferase [Bacteroidota bacterium]